MKALNMSHYWLLAGFAVASSVSSVALAASPTKDAQAFPDECVVNEAAKSTATDPLEESWFGVSVSIEGDWAVVGATWADCASGPPCGAAFVYRRNGNGWVEAQKLPASLVVVPAGGSSWFGTSVAISGDVIVVGAPYDDYAGHDAGAAYVFRRSGTTWAHEELTLTASDAAEGDLFGSSVSVSNDVIAVGAHRHACEAGTSCGSVYVYRSAGDAWVEEQKLVSSDAGAVYRFGYSISISGAAMLVGEERTSCASGRWCGAAYVFRFNGTTWEEEQKLVAPDAVEHDFFGRSVSLSGDVAVVGMPGDDCTDGPGCGSVYVFRFNGDTWEVEQKILHSEDWEGFGNDVAARGNAIMLGATGDDCAYGPWCGSAYLYHWNGREWIEKVKITPSDLAAMDNFGIPSIDGDFAIIGAMSAGCGPDFECGAAYIYDLSGCRTPVIIPTLSLWGITTMTASLLAAGAIVIVRKRRAFG